MKEGKIRRGGLQTPRGFLFELTGGDLSLDFTNTVDNRPTDGARELIPTYADLLSWAKQTGVLTSSQMQKLKQNSERFPKVAKKVHQSAVTVREVLFEAFSSLALKKSMPTKILEQLNKTLHAGEKHYDLVQAKNRLEWKPSDSPEELDWILWPIIRAAEDLLPSSKA